MEDTQQRPNREKVGRGDRDNQYQVCMCAKFKYPAKIASLLFGGGGKSCTYTLVNSNKSFETYFIHVFIQLNQQLIMLNFFLKYNVYIIDGNHGMQLGGSANLLIYYIYYKAYW